MAYSWVERGEKVNYEGIEDYGEEKADVREDLLNKTMAEIKEEGL